MRPHPRPPGTPRSPAAAPTREAQQLGAVALGAQRIHQLAALGAFPRAVHALQHYEGATPARHRRVFPPPPLRTARTAHWPWSSAARTGIGLHGPASAAHAGIGSRGPACAARAGIGSHEPACPDWLRLVRRKWRDWPGSASVAPPLPGQNVGAQGPVLAAVVGAGVCSSCESAALQPWGLPVAHFSTAGILRASGSRPEALRQVGGCRPVGAYTAFPSSGPAFRPSWPPTAHPQASS